MQSTSMVFQVRACAHTNLLIGTKLRDYNSDNYEFKIGASSNTKVTLHRNRQEVHSEDAEGLLHCEHLHWFWVSWLDGEIRFGTGEKVQENQILYYHDQSPLDIFTASLSMSDNEQTPAEWQIADDQG